MVFKLTTKELAKCLQNAFDKKYSSKVWNKIDVENFIVGNVGEMAYSKYSGLPTNFNPKSKGDGGIDFTDGTQIKTITWRGSDKLLKIRKKDIEVYKKQKVKRFVLCFVNKDKLNEVHILGQIKLTSFIKCCKSDKRFKDCLVVEHTLLKPL